MTVAIRLRCTCRRILATFDHGAERFTPAKRGHMDSKAMSPVDLAADLLGYIKPTELDTARIRCGNCNAKPRFSSEAFDAAKLRSETTGKVIDLLPL